MSLSLGETEDVILLQARVRELEDALLTLQAELDATNRDESLAAAKEIARRNRNLGLLLSREKGQVAKLTSKVKELQKKCKRLSEAQKERRDGEDQENSPKAENTAITPAVQQRIAKLQAELDVSKRTERNLRQLLKREIGENAMVILDNAMSNGLPVAGWRGRAEEITRLKQKLKLMSKRLNQFAQSDNIGESESTMSVSTIDSNTSLASATTTKMLASLREARRAEHAKAQLQRDQYRSKYEVLREKFQAQSARLKALEREHTSQKVILGTLEKKSLEDDKLIEQLRAELLDKVRLLRDSQARNDSAHASSTSEILQRLGSSNEELRRELESKCNELDQARDALHRLKEARWQEIHEELRRFLHEAHSTDVSLHEAEKSRLLELVAALRHELRVSAAINANQVDETATIERIDNALDSLKTQTTEWQQSKALLRQRIEGCIQEIFAKFEV